MVLYLKPYFLALCGSTLCRFLVAVFGSVWNLQKWAQPNVLFLSAFFITSLLFHWSGVLKGLHSIFCIVLLSHSTLIALWLRSMISASGQSWQTEGGGPDKNITGQKQQIKKRWRLTQKRQVQEGREGQMESRTDRQTVGGEETLLAVSPEQGVV